MQKETIVPVTEAKKAIGRQIERDHALIGNAENIPVNSPTPVVSVSPVVLSAPGRAVDL